WEPTAFEWAIELAEVMLEHFTDPAAGGFFFTADDAETLIVRPKTYSDDATPAGNGLAARLLVRLGYLLGETRYIDAAGATLRSARAAIERYPHGHGSLLMALDEYTEPPTIVVLRGPEADLAAWTGELDRLFDPHRMIIGVPSTARGLPQALAAKKPMQGTVAYVCRGMTCSAPVQSLGELIRRLKP
ncbi:MAG TPA: hypothetical protein VFI92_05790, partial [Steroidobacteraceae bacterium]|nr:hypothetical protein [Steroidobacteraceae bacterium]